MTKSKTDAPYNRRSIGRPRKNPSPKNDAGTTLKVRKPTGWRGAYRTPSQNDPPTWVDRNLYQIQEVLTYKTSFGKDFYEVAWTDLPRAANTWEPIANLEDDEDWPEHLERFQAARAEKAKVCPTFPRA